MKWIKHITVVAVLASTAWHAHAAMEKPVVIDGAMLSITVSDFHGLIDEVGGVIEKIQPGMGGMLKMMLGMQLGDPALTGIPVGSGLSVVALDKTQIFAVIEVAEAQSASYLSLAQSKGLQANYTNGVLVLALSEEILAKGIEQSDAVKNILLAKRSPTLRIALQPGLVLDQNQEALDGFMQMLPNLMGQGMMQQPGATLDLAESVTKLIEGELRVLLSLAEQCDKVEVVFAPEGGALTLSKTILPKAGTPLAALVNAPMKSKANPKIQSGLLGDATIKYDLHVANFEALGTFFGIEAKKVVQEMQLEEINVDAAMTLLQKWLKLYDGTSIESLAFEDGKNKIRRVTGITDEALVLSALKSMPTDLAPLLGLYEEFGMPLVLEFKENVREVAGTKIHQFVLKMDLTSMPSEQSEPLKAMGLDHWIFDLAITDGLMFYSEPEAMEELIQRVTEGESTSPLKARSDYPAGGFYYLDLDVGEYMAIASMMMPDILEAATLKQTMKTLFEGVPSLTSAGFMQDGCMSWSVRIPGELLARLTMINQM